MILKENYYISVKKVIFNHDFDKKYQNFRKIICINIILLN